MPKKNTKVLPEINWKKKFKKYYRESSSNNVTITMSDGAKYLAKGRKIFTVIIRDNLWKQFGSDYVVFGAFKNRIYFNKADKNIGYCVTCKNTTGYIKATLSGDDISVYEPFVGNYTLRFDEYYELYYIDMEREELDG